MTGDQGGQRVNGIGLIAAERQRQILEEGFTPALDASHYHDGQLVRAAMTYLTPPRESNDSARAAYWPWPPFTWKPCPFNRVRELAKAGALIAAEIDRIQAS